MPRQTLLLIIALAVVTSVLLFLAMRSQTTPPPTSLPSPTSPTPTPAEQTRLMLLPNPALIVPNATSSEVTVDVDTGENIVKGVQFELSYDPSVITNVKVTPGTFFENPEILLSNVDQKRGRIKYAIGVKLLEKGKTGTGTAAVISFRGVGTVGQSTKIDFIPKSIIAAENISSTAIRSEEGTNIIFSKATPTSP